MSFIHESLYQTKDFASINFSEYVLNLSRNLLHSYQLYGGAIELKHELEEVDLNLDQSIPCGLIINELVSNALKYAFPKGKEGVVTVRLNKKDEYIIFEVCDNGIGLPEKLDIETTDTLGLQLVITLVEQLSGDLVVDRKDGASFIVKFIGQE